MRKVFAFLIAVLFSVNALAMSFINDTEIESVVTEIIEPIANAAGIAPSRLHVFVVKDDEFNAFVMGGEDVYLYTGLLSKIKSPNALRAVIAHEMGHMLGGHMVQMAAAIEAEMRRAMLIQALGVGLMVAGGNPSLGAGVMAGASGVARQSLLSFSRDEERMADELGVNLMVRAGFNPNGFISVFEQMQKMTGPIESKVNPNAINHPLTAERLKNVRDKLAGKEIKNKVFATDDDKTISKYELVRAKLIGYLADTSQIKISYPYSDKSDAAIYARAIANMRNGNLAGAAVGTQTLISRQMQNPFFYELLGDLEYAYGHYDASCAAYEHAIELRPNSPQIETALAIVLTARDGPDDKIHAIELCKSAILQSPTPLAYWTLARAYSDDTARADWAMAEYYNLQNQHDKAKEYARRAKSHLIPDSPEYIKSDDILKQKH